MTGTDRLPVPEFLELELTVAQVFGGLKAGKPKGDRSVYSLVAIHLHVPEGWGILATLR